MATDDCSRGVCSRMLVRIVDVYAELALHSFVSHVIHDELRLAEEGLGKILSIVFAVDDDDVECGAGLLGPDLKPVDGLAIVEACEVVTCLPYLLMDLGDILSILALEGRVDLALWRRRRGRGGRSMERQGNEQNSP